MSRTTLGGLVLGLATVAVLAQPPLAITTTTLPNGVVGVPYSQDINSTGGKGPYQWSITAGSLPAGLSLNPKGTITGTPTAAGSSSFTAQVKDSNNTTASQALTIAISAPLAITTTSLPAGVIGVVYQSSVTASGGTGTYSWSLSGGSLPAGLTLGKDGTISGTPVSAIVANFTVKVTDSAGDTAVKGLGISITPPALGITTASLPGGTVGVAYQQTVAATGGTGKYTWSIVSGALPAGLTLSAGGTISGTPGAAGTANFTVQVSDNVSSPATKALSITIAPPPLTVTTASLPNGEVGVAYSQALSASGGTGGYTWSVASGNVPGGLSLGPNGVLSGTPNTPGGFAFTARVTDASSNVATKAFTISIAPQLVFTKTSLRGGTAGTGYSDTLTAGGGAPPYAWQIVSGALPPGLSLNTSNGSISGVPSQPGAFDFTAGVTDSLSVQATAALSITINTPLTITTGSTLAAGSVGAPYNQTFAAAGGAPPYSWSLSGTLPSGITFAGDSGTLSGTPTQSGAFTLSVQVTDSTSARAGGNFTLQIASGLTITTAPSLPAGANGTAYTATLQATGGSPPYQWTITAGSLPAGLSISATGQISGTPTAAGSFSFTAQVTDANSAHAQKSFTVAIAGTLTITTAPSLPGGATQAPYSQTLGASGGTPPYTWSVTGGSLPPGVALEGPSGALAGTPNAAGTFNFTVTVTDSTGVTAQKQFSITIGAGLTVVTPASLPGASVGSPYSVTLQAAGGQTPNSWSIAQGSLPGGLALNGATGVISGTPTVTGTFNFTVQVTDSASSKATKQLTLVVAVAGAPTVSINGLPADVQPLQQPSIDVAVSNPYPVAITGTLTLTFTPAGSTPVDDPSVQFSTGGRSATFTIPANATHATFNAPGFAVQTGSVTGTITVNIAALQAGGSNLPITGSMTATAKVDAAPPMIQNVTVTQTSGGFQLAIVAASNTRELTQAVVSFQPAAGSNLQNTQVTVPVGTTASAWFQSTSSAQFGGQFTLTLPFTFNGSVSLSSVSVTLANSVGTSPPASANF